MMLMIIKWQWEWEEKQTESGRIRKCEKVSFYMSLPILFNTTSTQRYILFYSNAKYKLNFNEVLQKRSYTEILVISVLYFFLKKRTLKGLHEEMILGTQIEYQLSPSSFINLALKPSNFVNLHNFSCCFYKNV